MAIIPLGPTTPCAGCGMMLLSSVSPVYCVTCFAGRVVKVIEESIEDSADTPLFVDSPALTPVEKSCSSA